VLPHRSIGPRSIDVAAPDPAAHFALRREQWKVHRLRIVDEHHVRLQPEPGRVLAIHLAVQVEVLLLETRGHSLDRVVEALGDLVEVGRAVDDLPPRLEPQLFHHRQHPAEDLGHAAADARRVHVHDAAALQLARQLAQPHHLRMSDHLLVLVEELHGDHEGLLASS
jgi:hypothetical protein